MVRPYTAAELGDGLEASDDTLNPSWVKLHPSRLSFIRIEISVQLNISMRVMSKRRIIDIRRRGDLDLILIKSRWKQRMNKVV
jgi:hypothetical protein